MALRSGSVRFLTYTQLGSDAMLGLDVSHLTHDEQLVSRWRVNSFE
jgi:hypothetical protein